MKKSLIISQELHNELKQYCDNKGLKINKFIELLIKEGIKNDRNLQNNKSK